MDHHHPVARTLHALLETRPDLKTALVDAIDRADLSDDFKDLDGFYNFVSRAVKQVPNNSSQMMQQDLAYYYVLSISKDRILVKDPAFQKWNISFNNAWAQFLDSEESLACVESYISDPSFEIGDYIQGPGGWRSYNQFFARQLKPGRRPIAGLSDPGIVVSPCDGTLLEIGRNTSDATIDSKGAIISISELLADSPFAKDFEDGLYWSILLQVYNYHRFHAPVAGRVLESRLIPGTVGLTIQKVDGKLTAVPRPGFQATQQRGLIVFENELMGKVAIVPVGMAQISSIALTAERDVELHKGEECGYFQFGGSNIIMLTEPGAFEPAKEHFEAYSAANMGIPYDQGELVGRGMRPYSPPDGPHA